MEENFNKNSWLISTVFSDKKTLEYIYYCKCSKVNKFIKLQNNYTCSKCKNNSFIDLEEFVIKGRIISLKEFNYNIEIINDDDFFKINIYYLKPIINALENNINFNRSEIVNIVLKDIDIMKTTYIDNNILRFEVYNDGQYKALENVIFTHIANIILEKYYYPVCLSSDIKIKLEDNLDIFDKIKIIQNLILKKNKKYN